MGASSSASSSASQHLEYDSTLNETFESDFVTQRLDRSCASLIFNLLSMHDFLICLQVSKAWTHILLQNTAFPRHSLSYIRSQYEADLRQDNFPYALTRSRWQANIKLPQHHRELKKLYGGLQNQDPLAKVSPSSGLSYSYLQSLSLTAQESPWHTSSVASYSYRSLRPHLVEIAQKLTRLQGLRIDMITHAFVDASLFASFEDWLPLIGSRLLYLSLGCAFQQTGWTRIFKAADWKCMSETLRILAIDDTIPNGMLLHLRSLEYLHFRGIILLPEFVSDIRVLSMEARLRQLWCANIYTHGVSVLNRLYGIDNSDEHPQQQQQQQQPQPNQILPIGGGEGGGHGGAIPPSNLTHLTISEYDTFLNHLPSIAHLKISSLRDQPLQLESNITKKLQSLHVSVTEAAIGVTRADCWFDLVSSFPLLTHFSLSIKPDLASSVVSKADLQRLLQRLPILKEFDLDAIMRPDTFSALHSAPCFTHMEKLTLTLTTVGFDFASVCTDLSRLPAFHVLAIHLTTAYIVSQKMRDEKDKKKQKQRKRQAIIPVQTGTEIRQLPVDLNLIDFPLPTSLLHGVTRPQSNWTVLHVHVDHPLFNNVELQSSQWMPQDSDSLLPKSSQLMTINNHGGDGGANNSAMGMDPTETLNEMKHRWLRFRVYRHTLDGAKIDTYAPLQVKEEGDQLAWKRIAY